MDNITLEELSKKSYEAIEEALESLELDDLLQALDWKSIRVGDTAAYLIKRRKAQSRVAKALLNNEIKRAKGRVRGTNILCQQGLACGNNIEVFEHLLDDRSGEVVDCALFGLAFSRSRRSLSRIKAIVGHLAPDDNRVEMFKKAIEAIESDDPSIYSPGFRDAAGVWQIT